MSNLINHATNRQIKLFNTRKLKNKKELIEKSLQYHYNTRKPQSNNSFKLLQEYNSSYSKKKQIFRLNNITINKYILSDILLSEKLFINTIISI